MSKFILNIPNDLHLEFKVQCSRNRVHMTDVLLRAIEIFIEVKTKPKKVPVTAEQLISESTEKEELSPNQINILGQEESIELPASADIKQEQNIKEDEYEKELLDLIK